MSHNAHPHRVERTTTDNDGPVIRKRVRPINGFAPQEPSATQLEALPAVDASVEAILNNEGEQLHVEYVSEAEIKVAATQLRIHSPKQLAAIRGSITNFGRNNVIFTNLDGEIIDGHARFEAMKQLNYATFPIIRLPMNSEMAEHYRVAANKIPEMTVWNEPNLKVHLRTLKPITLKLKIEPESLGIPTSQYDDLTATPAAEADDEEVEGTAAAATTNKGDLWAMGDHLVLCGDALLTQSYAELMAGDQARVVIADLPYNVLIQNNVSGHGRVKHGEFVQGSGEMSKAEFARFLGIALTRQAEAMLDGGIAFNFMNWRSLAELINAGEAAFGELKQLIIWTKTSGSMGSFYRNQHEEIAVFKKGTAPHVNNFGLGETGRYRTNVFEYAGANVFSKTRSSDLAAHPTVKPTVMIMDIIKDVSNPGELVLDPFGGSGTTAMAAEKTNRQARLIELDPVYVDTTVRRWEALTGKAAILRSTGQTFAQVSAARSVE